MTLAFGTEAHWRDALSRHVADRQAATGLQFATSARLRAVLGDGPAVDETEIPAAARETEIRLSAIETKNQPSGETEIPQAGETIIRRRGRPRIEVARPWPLAGVSRATWYRRQSQGAPLRSSHVV